MIFLFSKDFIYFYLDMTCESPSVTWRFQFRYKHIWRRWQTYTYAYKCVAGSWHYKTQQRSLPLANDRCHDLHYFLATRRRNSSINLLFEEAISATWALACKDLRTEPVPRRRRRTTRTAGNKMVRSAGKAIHRELAYRCLIHLT